MQKSSVITDFENLLVEAHFSALQSQSSVYGLACVESVLGPVAVLAAPVRGPVLCLTYTEEKPLSKLLTFSYIPGDAHVVSMDAFNRRSYENNSVVIGVAFIKPSHVSEIKTQSYFNVYTEGDSGLEFDINQITEGVFTLPLNFLPYQLSHTEAVYEDTIETVFLLTGSDCRVHMYREDKDKQIFCEDLESNLIFPEFEELQSIVTCLHIQYYDNYRFRVTALGTLNGDVMLFLTDTAQQEIKFQSVVNHDTTVTSVLLFTLITQEEEEEGGGPVDASPPDYDLLVNNSVTISVVYRSVLVAAFDRPKLLHNSNCFDSVLCGCVADIDLDGENELILGTYGEKLLIYKFLPERPPQLASRQSSPIRVTGPNLPADPQTTDAHGDLTPRKLILDDTMFDLPPKPNTPLKHEATSPEGTSILDIGSVTRTYVAAAETLETLPSMQDVRVGSLDRSLELLKVGEVVKEENREEEEQEEERTSDECSLRSYSLQTQMDISGYFLVSELDTGHPVMGLDYVDVTGAGFEKLVLLSQKGLHILHRNPEKVDVLCRQRSQDLKLRPTAIQL